ncbi:TRAP transporter large permease [Polycladidibacter stylochi]|uniref:TRAP transporter large permease n=1 Tax=Polycladidibacter stylochi TaxID=1807766 RepID=UPI0008322BB7|nr:TRAP transporter large permease [Pseudovibrio stylochi]
MILIPVVLALLLLLLGFEMFLVLAVPSLAIKEIYFPALNDVALIQKVVGGVNHTTLLAIPFFIFAAQLMGAGQIAKRLTDFIQALVGHTRGGMGHTTIGASMMFGSVSGSAPATVAAMGKMVYPRLLKTGFSEKFSLGLIVSSAETALLIPPSITLIIYGWMTGTSIAQLFAGGLAIGVCLGLAFAALVMLEARRSTIHTVAKTTLKERWQAFLRAGWALGMPLIILGGIYSGFVTPTEAAVCSVVYAIFVELCIYRQLTLKDLFDLTEKSALQTTVIFILLAFGGMISYFVTLAQVPSMIIGFLDYIDAGMILFLLVINICFLIAGMFIDPNSALLILIPPLYPVAMSLGVDPVHFGMIVTLNISLGMITPPFGLDIFVASSTLNKPVTTIVSGVWPFVIANILVLLLITYVPQISLFIPRLIFG